MIISHGFTPQIQNWIFASEGGYVDHPKDPGGATNMGITFRTLQAWLGRSITKQDVRNLTKETAAKIYKSQYWDTIKASSLPLGLDYATFDYAVNSGPARAVKDLQRIVGSGVDGVMGNLTLNKVKEYVTAKGTAALINALCERRWNFVQGLSTFKTFGNGWQRRIWGNQIGVQLTDTGVADRAIKLSREHIDTGPVTTNPGHAYPEENTIADGLKDPAALTGIAGAVATIFGAIQDQPILQIAAVLALAFVIYRFVIVKKKVDPA